MDNIYPEGTFITAKAHPETKLVINRYLQRVYFCEAVGDLTHKMLPYFERELIAPVSKNSPLL
ncbi:MAG TPA: hypothetical protein VIT44_06245 [Cyclobacteriaceae bacterium]